ncbi:MFS transporter [Sphingobium sufflavum]|uniref:MFS transporter n=1 Tax=Sphingobium sufflavum TaxID=1129547 RepID=UPI001F16995E|nr:MFS transporter [Sphingobium sufflavum]MCE7798015.1 MFS transporter [Sphingobium sufflavum]
MASVLTSSRSSAPPSVVAPASGRGAVLLACTIGNGVSVTPAVHAVFGLFLLPLSQGFGWSRASISVALGIVAVVGAILYPLVGRHIDRHGARPTLLVGVVGLALSIAALALTNGSLIQFYLTFAVIASFGAMAGTPIFQKLVADWFEEGRGTALGISGGVGCGVGSIVLPVIAAALVSHLGWRAGYLGIGAVMLLVALPILWFLLHDRAGVGGAAMGEGQGGPTLTELTLAEAMRTPTFWLLLVAIATGAGVTTAIFSHVVPILGDRGHGVATGTMVIGVFALVTSGWQVAMGRIMDVIPTPRIAVPLYAMAIAGLALLEFGGSVPALMLGGALLGIALGTQFGALPFFVARYFGMRAFGAIIGVLYSAVIAAQGITPILLDASYDAHHSYRHALVVAGICLAIGALLLLLLPRYGARTASMAEGMILPTH